MWLVAGAGCGGGLACAMHPPRSLSSPNAPSNTPPHAKQVTSAENPMFGSAQDEGAGGVNPLWAAGGAAGLGDEDDSPMAAPGAVKTKEVRPPSASLSCWSASARSTAACRLVAAARQPLPAA